MYLDLQPYIDRFLALQPGWYVLLGFFGMFWLIQLWYWAFRLSRLAGYKPELEPEAPQMPLPVSVIVCCHNDQPGIERLLAALRLQDYPNFEVIVVDDRSDEDTYDWLLQESRRPGAGFRLVRVNARPEHVSGKKYALTLGLKAAKHEAVLLTDADCLPASAEWVSRMMAALEGKRMALGYSPYERHPGLLNTLIRYDTFFTALQYASFTLAKRPYMGVGRNLAYQRSLFFDTKGFSSHAAKAGGDDDLFVNQAVAEGFAGQPGLCLHPAGQTISEPKTTFADWFAQKRRHLAAGKQYRSRDRWAIGLLQGSQVGFYLTGLVLLSHPPLTFIAALAFTARLPLTWIVQYKASRRLGERFALVSLPLLDAWMPVHYLVFGIPALLSKRISWS